VRFTFPFHLWNEAKATTTRASSAQWQEDMYRLEKLKSVGQRPYVMQFENVRGKPEYDLLAAWANQPRMFETMTFEVYKAKCKLREEGRKDVTAERSCSIMKGATSTES
jgi:hypothetical protein